MSSKYNYNITKLSKVVLRETVYDSADAYYDVQIPQLLSNTNQEPSARSHDVMPAEHMTSHQEAYYLYFVAIIGIVLNCVVVMAVFVRKPLRRMTSGFLIHACFLDLLKSAYCIPIGSNLLSQRRPSDCDFFGATFVIIVTISVFNMIAMVCTEAYTFGEQNVGGNSKGTFLCVIFGIVLVYIGSLILHLGPTLIGGHFEFQPDIGSCAFVLGKQTGYVANVMWIVITILALIAVVHFICKLYKEIQLNQPNRVSFLVRRSITVLDSATQSQCNLRRIIRDATHRAKIFIMNTIVFSLCWSPYFLLIVIDVNFKVAPKIYQTLAFIAWSHGAIQPILYILFDRHLNLLAKHISCDKRADLDVIAQLMLNRHRNNDQSEPRYSHEAGMPVSAPSIAIESRDTAGINSRREAPVDVIQEHHQMCVGQNSSNQSAAETNPSSNVTYQNTDQLNVSNPNIIVTYQNRDQLTVPNQLSPNFVSANDDASSSDNQALRPNRSRTSIHFSDDDMYIANNDTQC